MTWNYRIVIEEKGSQEEWWSIREVYYNKDGTICGMTEDAVGVLGVDGEELKIELLHMMEAFKKEPLVYDKNFKFADWDFGPEDVENDTEENK